jgi:hypothetical protein
MSEILSRKTTHLAIKRYLSVRHGRPDFDRFLTEMSAARMLERSGRTRALAAARKRRSRQKQLAEPKDGGVQISLRQCDSIKELNA